MININHPLLFNSFDTVGPWWNYSNIISPFNRIYLITEGEAVVYHNNTSFHLTPGKLFLIPKFTFHSYRCDQSMCNYYLCFFDEIAFGESLYDSVEMNCLVDALPGDAFLFERLNQLNPEGRIINPDPASYDNSKSLYSFSRNRKQLSLPELMEIQGIIYQLIARFVRSTTSKVLTSGKRFSKLTTYIHQHLGEKITLNDLAEIACLSPDYLSKQFFRLMGIRPLEYVNRIRMERAQMLLITSDAPINQIAEEVGIFSNSYFSTLFRKHTLCTPDEYRKRHFSM